MNHFQGWIISHSPRIIGWKVVPTYTEDWPCAATFLMYKGNNMVEPLRVHLDRLTSFYYTLDG